jgi:hypothetical protein
MLRRLDTGQPVEYTCSGSEIIFSTPAVGDQVEIPVFQAEIA